MRNFATPNIDFACIHLWAGTTFQLNLSLSVTETRSNHLTCAQKLFTSARKLDASSPQPPSTLRASTCGQGLTFGQAGVNLGPTWSQPWVNLGSNWGRVGVNLVSTW